MRAATCHRDAGVKPKEQRLGLNAWGPVVSLNLPVTLGVGEDVTCLCLSFFIREMGLVMVLTSQAREPVEVQARVPGAVPAPKCPFSEELRAPEAGEPGGGQAWFETGCWCGGSLKGPSGSEPFPKETEWGLTWRMEFLLCPVLSSSQGRHMRSSDPMGVI